jgi:hypothetical protein
MTRHDKEKERMKTSNGLLVGVIAAVVMGIGTLAVTAQEPKMTAPQATVPGIFTIKGQFVRIAYNNEGWVTLGYRESNNSLVGKDWLMLEIGVTVRKPTKAQTLTRDSFSVKLPDETMVPLATQKEYMGAGYLGAVNLRANTIRDSINYFPGDAHEACPMAFFSSPTNSQQRLSFDQFEVSHQRGCLGRLFFKLPEGKKVETGQYWLSVQFDGSEVQVPFRIMTKEEEKYFRKNWKNLKKEHEAFLKQEAEKAKQQQ